MVTVSYSDDTFGYIHIEINVSYSDSTYGYIQLFLYPLLRYMQTLNIRGNDMYRIHDMRSIALLCDESIDSYKNKMKMYKMTVYEKHST